MTPEQKVLEVQLRRMKSYFPVDEQGLPRYLQIRRGTGQMWKPERAKWFMSRIKPAQKVAAWGEKPYKDQSVFVPALLAGNTSEESKVMNPKIWQEGDGTPRKWETLSVKEQDLVHMLYRAQLEMCRELGQPPTEDELDTFWNRARYDAHATMKGETK